MAAVLKRDGTPISVPTFTAEQREQMAQAIAAAMVRLARADIEAAVTAYLLEADNDPIRA